MGLSPLHAIAGDKAAGLAAPELLQRLEQWLCREARATQFVIKQISMLSGGAIQENWSLSAEVTGGPHAGPHDWVLRTDAPSAVAVSLTRAQEYAVLRVAHNAGVQVARPLWLCQDAQVIGRDFFIMERLPGIAAAHRVTRDATVVPDGPRLAVELGVNLAMLHAVEPPNVDLSFLPLPAGNPALEAIANYRAYLDEIGSTHPVVELGLRWCELNAPETWRVCLIHRDYRTGNYMVHGGRLAGVLDWEFTGWGDPREDIGWFTAKCWRFAGRQRDAGGIAGSEDFMRGYLAAGGSPATAADLRYWQAMAHLRWAVIALQQAERHLSGRQCSLELALTGRLVVDLEYEILKLIGEDHA
ncbi:MAG: phosphotransferase family protein [Rhodocyclaceae bacterium]|nr:phosphotransferase family protein [Rhodocyclaceae bacterium]MBX3669182.1 phosphotransferase family protein [Rhodocyclaceae bacterium]